MRTPVTLFAFFFGLFALFGLAISLGDSVGSLFGSGVSASEPGDEPGGHGSGAGPEHGEPTGLAIADQGYLLLPTDTRLVAGRVSDFSFNIFTVDRAPVTEFAVEQDREMRLIVVRRDLTEYQQLLPTMGPDGTWSVRLRLDEPGSYRVFTTFRPETAPEPVTLGVDLNVPGLVEAGPVQHPKKVAEVDEYSVVLSGETIAGGTSRLYLAVMRDDQPVTDLEPYLGTTGHLVMLREGDLAYLPVSPVAGTGSGPTITFEAGLPTAGYYRLFLDFQHRGEVRTAEFTVLAS